MAIDTKRYYEPAVRRDIGKVAINLTVALYEIATSLEKLQRGEKFDEELKEIREIASSMSEHFNELSGWTDGE